MDQLSEMRSNAVLVGSRELGPLTYQLSHPLLTIPRGTLALDLIEAYGAIAEGEYIEGSPASADQLEWFHTRAYLDALRESERLGYVTKEDRQRFNIGNMENPWFPDIYGLPARAAGCSIRAAEEVIAGRMAFSPMGGMHHTMPDKANGFGYVNDCVLAIHRLRQEGLRVLYVDIDAHHGNGVESAFLQDPDVFTLSLHMDTLYAYPYTGGQIQDFGGKHGGYACLNVPLPAGTHDAEYELVIGAVLPEVMSVFKPDVVVLEPGTDILFADPLGKFRISTQYFLRIVEQVKETSPRLLVLGGGGYHPILLARCWVGVWEKLSGRSLPLEIPKEGQALLEAVGWDEDEDKDYYHDLFVSRADKIPQAEVRPEFHALLDKIRRLHPLMGSL